uniref:CCN family member 3 n=1 Tax=Pelodiscus sinensis TaxID=13735 RepID=K7FIF1_PELSI
ESPACSYPCQCPSQPLQCPVGTSHVWDACGCCKVCARQLGELCSLQKPCDHHKGLYCDFSKIHRASGICLAHEGATCDLLGKIYHNGESFQPTCQLQCICMDGAIGAPSPDCPSPHRGTPQAQCCEEWICQGGSQENRFETTRAVYQDRIPTSVGVLHCYANCLVQTTAWSACSKSCGMGISTRVTNDNPQCRPEKESRLCLVRPCDFLLEQIIKKGKKCVRTPKPRQGIRLEFSGCTSSRFYRPKFCGSCTDGRCCTPHSTSTVEVEFKCPEGDVFQHKIMFIKTCSCHRDCPRDNDVFL